VSRAQADPVAERTSLAEVLRAILENPADLDATLQAIIDRAVALCRTDKGFIYLRDGEVFRHAADAGAPPEVVAFNRSHPLSPTRGTLTGRVAIERKPVHIADVLEDPEYEYWEAQSLGSFRSLLGAPMLYQGEVVGVMSVWRDEPQPFSDREIDLLAVFADQAALALETSRLIDTVSRQLGALSRFLPRQVAELISAPEGARMLEGHRREITVVFADLRGFTSFAADAEPEQVIEVLGSYHETMGRVVDEYEGTLSGFSGDGLMIFFNDPQPMVGHAQRAIDMARAMRTAFAPLATDWRRLGFLLGLGVGIATGYATLGRIGYEGRYDYGPIGSIVNLAARLCNEAPAGGILASPSVLAAARVDDAQPVEPLTLKGFPKPMPAYSL
jgi:adenylate cyclase